MKSSALDRFAENIQKLLRGEEVDLYESLIDSSFEYIAAEILSTQLKDGVWYDGTRDLVSKKVGENQIEFSGNMSVCLNQDQFWQEPFFALVTDNRDAGKGMPIFVRMGDKEGKEDIFEITWLYKNT